MPTLWDLFPPLVLAHIADYLVECRATFGSRGRRLLHDTHDAESKTLSDERIERSALEDLYNTACTNLLLQRVSKAWTRGLAGVCVALAEDRRRSGDYAAALTLVGSVARAAPDALGAAALTHAAAARLAARDRDGRGAAPRRALLEATAAVGLAPRSGDARAQLGRALICYGRMTEAVVSLEAAVADRLIVGPPNDFLAKTLADARRSAAHPPASDVLEVTVEPSGPWVADAGARALRIRGDAPLKALLDAFPTAAADLRLVDVSAEGRHLDFECAAQLAGVASGSHLLLSSTDRRDLDDVGLARRRPLRDPDPDLRSLRLS